MATGKKKKSSSRDVSVFVKISMMSLKAQQPLPRVTLLKSLHTLKRRGLKFSADTHTHTQGGVVFTVAAEPDTTVQPPRDATEQTLRLPLLLRLELTSDMNTQHIVDVTGWRHLRHEVHLFIFTMSCRLKVRGRL